MTTETQTRVIILQLSHEMLTQLQPYMEGLDITLTLHSGGLPDLADAPGADRIPAYPVSPFLCASHPSSFAWLRMVKPLPICLSPLQAHAPPMHEVTCLLAGLDHQK
jgi:hypothetical protein